MLIFVQVCRIIGKNYTMSYSSIGYERTNIEQRMKPNCKSESEGVRLWWLPRSWSSKNLKITQKMYIRPWEPDSRSRQPKCQKVNKCYFHWSTMKDKVYDHYLQYLKHSHVHCMKLQLYRLWNRTVNSFPMKGFKIIPS